VLRAAEVAEHVMVSKFRLSRVTFWGRRVLGGADEHSRFARADPNASQPLCHVLLPSMPLRSVAELRDPFLLGWGVGRVLRSQIVIIVGHGLV